MRKLQNSELERKTVDEFKSADKLPVVIVLDNVRSASNVGSVFRTADGLLIEAVYLCGITARPPHKEIQKTALGATESVSWHYFTNTTDAIAELRQQGYALWAVEQCEGSVSMLDFVPEPGKRYAFILGNEVNGVAQDVVDSCEACLEIPQLGTKHSLNVSITAGIVMWEAFRALAFDR